jgi:hypothetical protein
MPCPGAVLTAVGTLLAGCVPSTALVGPSLSLTPASARVGSSVSAVAADLPAGRAARVLIGDRQVGAGRTSAKGSLSVTFVVPPRSAGSVRVTARAGSVAARATLIVLAPRPAGVWRPAVRTPWQIQYTTPVDLSVPADVYFIDGFDNDKRIVDAIHAKGARAVCYFSAGSWEAWRPDAGRFPASVLGAANGWPGERWVDIRRLDVLGPILIARMDMCRRKGFDGVDPDNVDGYANETGFELSATDQLTFNRWLSEKAHARGMAIGLKNDVHQVAQLEPSFEWSQSEQCNEYGECDLLMPFIAAGKPVFNVEYGLTRAQFCRAANARGFMSLRKDARALDAWREACWTG